MDTVVVIMQKDKKSGFLEKELASLSIEKYEELIVNIFAMENDDEELYLHMKVTTDRDVLDWEFSAIFDYYDNEVFGDKILEVIDTDDNYNPTWEIILKYNEDIVELEETVEQLLMIHQKELIDVYNTIKDKESEYTNEEE